MGFAILANNLRIPTIHSQVIMYLQTCALWGNRKRVVIPLFFLQLVRISFISGDARPDSVPSGQDFGFHDLNPLSVGYYTMWDIVQLHLPLPHSLYQIDGTLPGWGNHCVITGAMLYVKYTYIVISVTEASAYLLNPD